LHSYSYDAFGNEVAPDARNTNPFRFTGQYLDFETGNYYLRARFFNPRTGRFTQPDPYWNLGNMRGSNAAILQSGNLFLYVMNNPIMWVDPWGLKVKLEGTEEQRETMLELMQEITDYTLYLDEDNYVQILSRPDYADRKFPEGNKLIQSVIDSSFTTTIRIVTDRKSEIGATCWASTSNGVGSNASIYLNLDDPVTGGIYRQLRNPDCALNSIVRDPSGWAFVRRDSDLVPFLRSQTPMFIILAHELIHADAYMQGNAKPQGSWDGFVFIEHTPSGSFVRRETAMINGEEHRAIYLENRIRAEQGLWLRGIWQ